MKRPERPRLELAHTPVEWAIEAVAALGIVIFVAATAWLWPKLPDRIPMHFDLAGNVNRYGSRAEWFVMPCVALATYVGLSFLARVPHLYNFPVRITPENAARQYRLGRVLVVGLKAAVVWMMLAIAIDVGRVALGERASPSPWIVIGPLVVILGGVAAYLVAALRAR